MFVKWRAFGYVHNQYFVVNIRGIKTELISADQKSFLQIKKFFFI